MPRLYGRLIGLDGLRGLLALFVAYSHSFSHFLGWDSKYSFMDNVFYAVDVFFIMSGVVLYHAYKNRFKADKEAIKKFIIVRVMRLLPVHIFTMFAVLIAFLVTTGVILPSWIPVSSARDVILDTSLLSSLGLFGSSNILNHPSWSISVELWIGSLIMLIALWRWKVMIVVALFSTLMIIYADIYTRGGSGPIYYFLSAGSWRCLLGISLGVISYNFFQNVGKWFNQWTINFVAASSLVLIFMIMVGFMANGSTYVLLMILTAMGILFIPKSNGWVVNILECAPIKRLGDLSFSLYLIHVPVIYFFLPLKNMGTLAATCAAHVAVICSIYLSIFVSKHVEKRFAYKWKSM